MKNKLAIIRRIHHKFRTTPSLGRFALGCIPDVKIYLKIECIGLFAIRLRQHRMYWVRNYVEQERFTLASVKSIICQDDIFYDIELVS